MSSVVKMLVFAKSKAEPHGNVINFARLRQKVNSLKMKNVDPMAEDLSQRINTVIRIHFEGNISVRTTVSNPFGMMNKRS